MRGRIFAAAALLAVAGVACSEGGTTASKTFTGVGTEIGNATTVQAKDNVFEPKTITVKTGTTVTWNFVGQAPHTATGEGFDSGVKTTGSFSHTFDTPGTIEYKCTVHPEMTGTIEVTA